MDALQDATQRIQKALEHLKRELATIRAGRANPSLVEELPIMAYGARMKLMEVGTITAPQPSLLTIQVWDAGLINDVQKAIQEANIGISPSIDGQTVRLPIPPLNEERRTEFVKMAHQKGEACRIEIRQVRQEAKDTIEKGGKAGDFGEDEQDRYMKQLQDLVDNGGATIDELVKAKEAELMQV